MTTTTVIRPPRAQQGAFSILAHECTPQRRKEILSSAAIVLACVAALMGCSGTDAKKSDAGGSPSGGGGVQSNGGNSNASGSKSAGGASNAPGTTAAGGMTNAISTAGGSSVGGAPSSGGVAAGGASSTGSTACTGGTSSAGSNAPLGGITSTSGTRTSSGSSSSAGSNAGGANLSSGGSNIGSGGGASAAGGLSAIGGSSTGGTSSQSTCPTDCNDGFSCTVDSCVNGKCQSVIGPPTGMTACPIGQYCTVNAGCIAAPVCATVDQCQNAWKDDACKANLRCDAASSLCMFSVLDKDSDGHAPLVCGGDDCNDGIASIHPGAPEQCNGVDDDCDGVIDNDASDACKTTEMCVGGACTCKPENLCGSKCLDVLTDAANCGGCGKKCAAGASCVAGDCTCPIGQLECVGACSNPETGTSTCPRPVQLAPGGVQTCILLSDGSARCWGLNADGQLGDGTTTNSPKPVLVRNISDGVELAGGYAHTCVLHGSNAVSCWGDKSLSETSVGSLSGIREISSGSGFHSCARLTDGTITCWGSIYYASDIAYGTPIVYSSSSLIPGVADAVEIASGYEHSCTRITDGTLKCWGWNDFGQLGDGTANSTSTAVAVQGITDAIEVAPGGMHTCARLGDGTAKCWGDYSRGQLGDVSAYLASMPFADDAGIPSGLPPMLIDGIAGALQITAGRMHSCALVAGGTVKCWGRNSEGQLGDGITTDQFSPVVVVGLSNVVEIAAGAYHTCARLGDGSVKCWGSNTYGQLGDDTRNDSSVPVTVVGF